MDELDRIKKIMQTEEMNSAQFATEIGIQGSTLSHILNGRNNPSLDVHKKILNRFRTISSDWLILGIGSMYRSEKQSQTPTLFDPIDENISKSTTYVQKSSDENESNFSGIQKNNMIVPENPAPEQKEVVNSGFHAQIEIPAKTVRKIIVYYTDNTFQEFESK
jgi:DNA-binding XRE family transcriptional regulator